MIIEPDTHRKFTRIIFDGQVDLEFISDSYHHCRIKNLSLAGMFAIGDFQKQVGKNCNIDLVPADISKDLRLQALAKVVRKNDEGIAIKFTSMPFDSYIFLQATLLNEAEDLLVNKKILAEDYPFEVADDFPISPESYNSFL